MSDGDMPTKLRDQLEATAFVIIVCLGGPLLVGVILRWLA